MNELIVKRKCAGCSELFNRNSLIKITKEHSSSHLVINPDSKTFGRSVYICKNKECIEKAFKKNRLFKILKTHIDDSLKEKLLSQV